MTPSDRTGRPKVTIEALIQLKRAERPPAEFWDRFDRELRVKQLAAIVEKRPWWHALLPRPMSRPATRATAAVAAAALGAIALMVVREYHPASGTMPVDALGHTGPVAQLTEPVVPVVESTAPMESISVAEVVLNEHDMDQIAANAALILAEAGVIESPRDRLDDAEPLSGGSLVSEPSGLTEMIPWAVAPTTAPEPTRVAAVPGDLPQVHFVAGVLPEPTLQFDGRVEAPPAVLLTKVVAVETPAEQKPSAEPVLSPREVRRHQILSSLMVADNGNEAEHSRMGQIREMFANALDEDRLYDSVRRLGMGGDRLTLKF